MWCKRWSFALIIILVMLQVLLYSSTYSQTDSLSSQKASFTIYPVFGYQPETRFAFGVISFIVYDHNSQKMDEYYRPSTIAPYFLYTLNHQMLIAIDGEMYFKNGYYLDIKPRFYKYPDFFYGVGNDNDIDNEEIYTNEFFRVDGRLMKFFSKIWSVGLRFDIQNNRLYDFDQEGQLVVKGIFGIDGGLNSGIGPTIQVDTRDNTLYPSRGIFARAEANFYANAFGGDFNYAHFVLDFRKYMSIKSEKNIIALQIAGNFTSGDKIPFYKLQKVGGDKRLRGIENANLYMDKQSFWMQAEYRRTLFWRFGGVAFAGFGDVASGIDKFKFKELKYVVGLGGRFQAMKEEKLNIRLDAGLGPGGQYAFYLSVQEAF